MFKTLYNLLIPPNYRNISNDDKSYQVSVGCNCCFPYTLLVTHLLENFPITILVGEGRSEKDSIYVLREKKTCAPPPKSEKVQREKKKCMIN